MNEVSIGGPTAAAASIPIFLQFPSSFFLVAGAAGPVVESLEHVRPTIERET